MLIQKQSAIATSPNLKTTPSSSTYINPPAAPKNNIQAEYSDNKSVLKELEQKIEVQKLFDAEAKYSASKNKMEVKINIEGQKQQKETRTGIVILELLTDKGGLKLRY